MNLLNFLCCLLLLWLTTVQQSNSLIYQINGTVRCRDQKGLEQPYQNEALIELWEEDVNMFSLIDKDDQLGKTKSSKEDGKFVLTATKDEWELGELEPYLLVRHICWGEIHPEEDCTLISRMDLQSFPEQKVLSPIILGADSQLKTGKVCE